MASKVNPDVVRLTALSQICESFAKACEDRSISVSDAYLALGRMLNIGAPSIEAPSKVPVQQEVKLSEEQKTLARKLAREAKAKRLKVQPSEINLTVAEVKQALEDFSKGVLKQSSDQKVVEKTSEATGSSSSSKKGKGTAKEGEKSSSSGKTSGSDKSEQGVTAVARAVAKAKIDSQRRNALRALPSAHDPALVLHLLVYQNLRWKLFQSYSTFLKSYDSKNMLNPLRGLPDYESNQEIANFIGKLSEQIGMQCDHDDTEHFHLQDAEGKFWYDRDMPGKTCPQEVADLLPQEILEAIEIVRVQVIDEDEDEI